MVIGTILWYLGLKEKALKIDKKPIKTVNVQGNLFMVSKKEFIEHFDPNSVQHVFVIKKEGLTLYSQSLHGYEDKKRDEKEALLGGTLSAIDSLMKEMSEKKEPLKEVKREGYTIMIEEGKNVFLAVISTQSHTILREKMKQFISEFEEGFKELLDIDVVDTKVFSPVKILVNKYFE